ncbi:hypothetical protein M3Y99_00939200 [Aphelenchoides fujianensis]|nr:hypothetical protein M3Y99_00939200 [Aphelenchoides fujianensis]
METADFPPDQPQNPEDPAVPNEKKQEFVCPDCELVCRDSLRLRQHALGHLLAAGWECAVCGVRFANAFRDRNRHEQNVHCLMRHTADLQRMEAVRISKRQLPRVVNVGNRLVATQLAARPSLSAANDEAATADELRAHMLKTLRPRMSEIPVAGFERPIAAEDLPQPTEQTDTAVKDLQDETGVPRKNGQKRIQRVLPVQPFERLELFGSDDDEEETEWLIASSSPKIRKLSTHSAAASPHRPTKKTTTRSKGESSAVPSQKCDDLKKHSNSEQMAGWGARLRSREATSSKSQGVKGDASGRSSLLGSESESEEEEEGAVSGSLRSSQSKNSAMLFCSACGLPVAVQHLRKHSKGHSLKAGWQCALCGIRVATQRKRRVHEEGFHGLRRGRFDQDRKEAILLDDAQLMTLRSIGTNFDEIQRGAVRSVAAFVHLPTLLPASRQASAGASGSSASTNVVVLDS